MPMKMNEFPQPRRRPDDGAHRLKPARWFAAAGRTRPVVAALIALLAAIANAPADPVHDAAGAGDLAAVKTLLAAHPESLNAADAGGWTPLHYAVSNGATAVVETLLEAGADIRAATNEGQTPLHVVRDRAMTNLLLAHGADVTAINRYGETPLHIAAGAGRKDVAEALLAHGAAIDARNQGGWTPLHAAVMQGHPDLVELLLAQGADIQARDRQGRTPLDFAEKAGNTALVALLSRHGAVHAAAGHSDRVAVPADFEKAVALVRQEHVAEARAFLEARPALARIKDQNGWTLLAFAADHDGDKELVEYLLDRGADVNARDNDNRTPLHGAAAFNCLETARLLLDRGANANARNRFGLTPLHAAALAARTPEMAELLLAHGADINARDDSGDTPLQASLFNQNPGTSLAEFLIAKGADLNARNDRGETPLAVALKGHAGPANDRLVAVLRAHHAPQ